MVFYAGVKGWTQSQLRDCGSNLGAHHRVVAATLARYAAHPGAAWNGILDDGPQHHVITCRFKWDETEQQ
eukprot:9501336-Lingulodinium_polyedra.AAC.1